MLHIGILGAGNFAAKHLRAVDVLAERARVVKAARQRPESWPEAEARGIEQVSAEALLDAADIDAVAVCLPNALHAQYVEASLRAGKHVFCEKPLATNLEDADRLIGLARDQGRALVVGHLTRHSAPYAAAAEILQSGRLGPVRALHSSRLQVRPSEGWRLDQRQGGSAAFDLLVHDFDLLGWYLGRPRTVVARAAEGYLLALFDYGHGVAPVVEGGFVLPEGSGFHAALRIICENGMMEADASLPRGTILRVIGAGASPEYVPASRYEAVAKGLVGEYEEFLGAVEGRVQGRLTLDDARQAVEMAVRTTEAAGTGQAIPFDVRSATFDVREGSGSD